MTVHMHIQATSDMSNLLGGRHFFFGLSDFDILYSKNFRTRKKLDLSGGDCNVFRSQAGEMWLR